MIVLGDSVPDGVAGSQSDPLGNWTVLLLRFRKLLLRSEGLVALQIRSVQLPHQIYPDLRWAKRTGILNVFVDGLDAEGLSFVGDVVGGVRISVRSCVRQDVSRH